MNAILPLTRNFKKHRTLIVPAIDELSRDRAPSALQKHDPCKQYNRRKVKQLLRRSVGLNLHIQDLPIEIQPGLLGRAVEADLIDQKLSVFPSKFNAERPQALHSGTFRP